MSRREDDLREVTRRSRTIWFSEATGLLVGGQWIDVMPGSEETIQTPWVRWETTTGAVLVDTSKIAAIRVVRTLP